MNRLDWNNIWKITREYICIGLTFYLLTGSEHSFWAGFFFKLFVSSALEGKLVQINAIQE